GNVLVAGNAGDEPDSAERYDPALNHWSEEARMPSERRGGTAVRLVSGMVLELGGLQGSAGRVETADVYDAAGDRWVTAGLMDGLSGPVTAGLLGDGRVLVVASAGKTALYVDAWTNKPPLHIWAVALPLSLFGPREAGLHALTFVSGLLAFLALAFLAGRLLKPRRALVASIVFGLAIGLPLFQAELLVPESLLIAPATWAGLLVLTRVIPSAGGESRHWMWAVLAGGLMGIAVGFQQTALADAAVFALIIALVSGVSRRGLLG